MEAYLGQTILFGGTFAMTGWLTCNGQLLPISEYEALYSILGTTYGGDGVTTFALPKLARVGDPERGPQYLICVDGVYPSRG